MVYPEGFYKGLLDFMHDGVYLVDDKRRITYWSATCERITGFSSDEVVGSFCHNNILQHVDRAGTRLCLRGCPLHATLADGRLRDEDLYLHHKSGHRVPVRVRVVPIRDAGGSVLGAAEIFTEKGSRATLERRMSELRRRLQIDPLTQIPNRDHAERSIRSRLFELQNGGLPFGVTFMDVDRFKRINDDFGHEAGDRALKTVATTLAANVRPTDVIARWGGEEFVGVFAGVDAHGLDVVCGTLLALVRSSDIAVGAERFSLTISIGATLVRPDDSVPSLLRRADDLMYRSKNGGRDRVTLG